MLNNGKGPAVRSLRAQADKITYPKNMLKTLKKTTNLDIKEGGNVLWLGTRDNGLVRFQITTNTEYPYDSIEEAVEKIKELEIELDNVTSSGSTDAQTIADLQAQIEELIVYKQEQADFEKEKERLMKEKEKLEKELARSKGMLSNEKFLSKAPEAKVQEEKDKLAKYEQMMAQVEERLAQMK